MSKQDKFAFISESLEPLLLADFKTRQVLAVSNSLTKLFGSSSNTLVNAKLDSIITILSKVVDFSSFFETVEKRGVAKTAFVSASLEASLSLQIRTTQPKRQRPKQL